MDIFEQTIDKATGLVRDGYRRAGTTTDVHLDFDAVMPLFHQRLVEVGFEPALEYEQKKSKPL